MSENCKICGNDHNNRFYTLKEMMFGTRHLFDYLECSQCGAIQILNPPVDLSVYYPDNYYAYITLNESSNLRKALKRIRWKLYGYLDIKPFQPLYGDWLKRAEIKLDDRIADIGCGNGQLLYEMYASGFKNLVGIDPFIESSKNINPCLSLLKKDIYEIEDSFDFIMMHHSFEHMDEPKNVMQIANKLLKPGKQLLIRIPISDGEAWTTYGVHWVQLDPPRHIFIHSVKSIQLLAEQTGFEISQIVYDSDAFQFWASEAIRNDIPSTKAHGTVTKKELKQYNRRARELNKVGKGDQACFYLRKKQA
jgi:SAM-dependent methyltransferase